jgi:amino-acid N-acetyltransferase
MSIRKASLHDAKTIKELISTYAKKDLMLEKSITKIWEDIRSFYVYKDNEKVVGCCSIAICWEDLAEIKSLAVAESFQNKGIGKQLVSACIDDAKELGIKKIFTLTYQQEFFEKAGFKKDEKGNLPQKIWAECVNCHKFPDCNEICLILNI